MGSLHAGRLAGRTFDLLFVNAGVTQHDPETTTADVTLSGGVGGTGSLAKAGAARLAFALYNTEADVDLALRALR